MTNSNQHTSYWAVIPAAGVGKRMQSQTPKQYIPLFEKSILFHTLSLFIQYPKINGIVVAISEGDEYWPEVEQQLADWQRQLNSEVPILVAPGGQERSDSVLNALLHIQNKLSQSDWVLVHDAARPCLIESDIDKLIEQLAEQEIGGLLGLPMADTVKMCSTDQLVQKTVDRSQLWRALTPQMFRYGVLCQGLLNARDNGLAITDESSAVELLGYQPVMIEGHNENIKITHPDDLALAQKFLTKDVI